MSTLQTTNLKHPSSASNNIVLDSSGRVGIGATTPSTALDVSGAISLGTVAIPSAGTARIFSRNTDNNLYIQTGSGSAINLLDASQNTMATFEPTSVRFQISNSEKARLDSSGRFLVGTSTARIVGSVIPALQLSGDVDKSSISLSEYANDIQAPRLMFGKSRGTSDGSYTVVQSGDYLGVIAFAGADGSSLAVRGAEIAAYVDGTPGSNDMPGRLVFSVTRDGSASPSEALRIRNTGMMDHTSNNPSGYALVTQNDGNSSDRYGLRILCGTYAATGTNYAVSIEDGDGGNQGYITFTGGTVTYGAFTAHHPCILPEADNKTGYPYGTLLETTSIEYTQKDGHNTERGILYNVCKTQAANSRAVLGAYGSSMNGGPNGETNRHQALVLGDGHILCNNSGGNIKVGDGICSSATPGIGQKATATPSMAIGIAQEDVTFADDEEVKLVAVQYGVRQFIPWGA
jgi:hypothetical protein